MHDLLLLAHSVQRRCEGSALTQATSTRLLPSITSFNDLLQQRRQRARKTKQRVRGAVGLATRDRLATVSRRGGERRGDGRYDS